VPRRYLWFTLSRRPHPPRLPDPQRGQARRRQSRPLAQSPLRPPGLGACHPASPPNNLHHTSPEGMFCFLLPAFPSLSQTGGYSAPRGEGTALSASPSLESHTLLGYESLVYEKVGIPSFDRRRGGPGLNARSRGSVSVGSIPDES